MSTTLKINGQGAISAISVQIFGFANDTVITVMKYPELWNFLFAGALPSLSNTQSLKFHKIQLHLIYFIAQIGRWVLKSK